MSQVLLPFAYEGPDELHAPISGNPRHDAPVEN